MSVLEPLKILQKDEEDWLLLGNKDWELDWTAWENNMYAVLSNFKDLYLQNTFLGHFVHGGADPTADCTHTAVIL